MLIKAKRIKEEIYDKLTVAKLSQNKVLQQELENKYQNQMFEEIEIELDDKYLINSYEQIPYVSNLLDKELDEHDEGLYAGISESHLYEFDFSDESVTISINLIHNYIFLPEYKRVWFFTDLYKKAYLYANYETGDILDYVGPDNLKSLLLREFNSDNALKYILEFSGAENLEELFKYYYKK